MIPIFDFCGRVICASCHEQNHDSNPPDKKSKEVQPLDRDSALAWQPTQDLLWLHFDVNEDAAKQWLLADGQLPQAVTAGLLAGETRPRANTISDGVLLTLRGVNLNPDRHPVT